VFDRVTGRAFRDRFAAGRSIVGQVPDPFQSIGDSCSSGVSSLADASRVRLRDARHKPSPGSGYYDTVAISVS
jgi:hypothetical protein